MGKIEDLLIERTSQSIIEIGQILEKFYNGQAGIIFRAMINGRIKEQISQIDDIKISSERRLGRAEAFQIIQDDIELAIEQSHNLDRNIE